MMMDLQLLKQRRVKVVGMTTSGAARMRKLLQAIAPKIGKIYDAITVDTPYMLGCPTTRRLHLMSFVNEYLFI